MALASGSLLTAFLKTSLFSQNKKPVKAKTIKKIPDIAVIHSKDPEKNTRAAVEMLGGMDKFVKNGDKVVVKPNIGWDRNPEQAATTNPIVVATLVKMALEAGAKEVKVFDRTCHNAKRCYANSGIEKAAKDAGAIVQYAENESDYINTKINGMDLEDWPIHKDVLACDCFINVPIAKQHGSTELTLSMKNLMGVVGGNRGKFHAADIDQWIADIAKVVVPKLIVMDATRILLRHGPTGGNLADVQEKNTIIASVDPVACDAYTTRLFNKTPDDVTYIRYAFEQKLGEINLKKLNVQETNI
ncbi:MAG: hypothetical protein A2252_10815 [Elusimicrobia bacterium RIFOXYA2_FULL_39_19]|nr:MAG: hypothetical protein A2252_10815 [Elusimicrobia bacterium RIFOXYA2_FULL_39_19]